MRAGSLGAVRVELDGRRTPVKTKLFGLGFFGVLVPDTDDPIGPGSGGSNPDVVTTTTYQDDLLGHWEFFFAPPNRGAY